MLFNSYTFIFIFLPVVLLIFFAVGKHDQRLGVAWLVSASLFFYAWWNPRYLLLLLGSIVFNYGVGTLLIGERRRNGKSRKSRAILSVGLVADLALLSYYKYTHFFVENFNALSGMDWNVGEIILPLGISFFTFTQIAFLVDAYRGEVKTYNFIHYALFITYFPHLIAGPILHHKEMIPQFTNPSTFQWNAENIAAGLTVFFIGLFKKTVLADGIAPHAVTVFAVAAKGQDLTFLEAWLGGICYIFQLYFDFSGYCDMAIGGSLTFGIKLPLNFHSPYKAVNIFEFWRRWHMTLSRFLRDYIYTPLSHGRQKPWRLMMNLVITMIVGGVWHGAGWNYFLWGAMHGFFLSVNHLWRNVRRQVFDHDLRRSTRLGQVTACALTIAAFTFSMALFRSPDLESGVRMMKGMLGLSGIALPLEWRGQFGSAASFLDAAGVSFQQLNTRVSDTGFRSDAFKWVFYLGVLVWMMPNTQQIMGRYFPALAPYQGDKQVISAKLLWAPTPMWAVVTSVVAIIGLANITKVSEFLYYQF